MSEDNSGSPSSNGLGRGFYLSAAVVAAILVMGIALVVTTAIGDDNAEPSSEPSATTATPNQSNDPNASVCGLEGYETSGSLTEAPATDWDLVGRYVAPRSETAGPGVVDDGPRRCFAHTPEGAVVMAANFPTWQFLKDPTEVLDCCVAAGSGRDAAAAQMESDPGRTAGSLQLRGFRIQTYTGDSALIDVAFLATVDSSTTLVSFTLELVWEDGDWRARPTPTGEFTGVNSIPDLTGFVPMSGS